MRPTPPVPVLDPDPDDPRLAALGDGVEAWRDGDVLTIAARRPGRLCGTFDEELRPAGDRTWALRFRVRGLDRAAIEYALREPGATIRVWRGPRAPEAAPRPEPVAPLPAEMLGDGAIAEAHPVTLWLPPAEPRALVVCADGDGVSWWAGLLTAAGEPVALLGVSSGAARHRIGEEYAYDLAADPRARAYLRHVDPDYFVAHRDYVLDTVLPWAADRVDPALPRVLFGCSNGASWVAQLGLERPEPFAAVLAFSIGAAPAGPVPRRSPRYALVAGRLEAGFDRTTSAFARRLRLHGVPVRLRRRLRGHDASMWHDEFLPALSWALDR